MNDLDLIYLDEETGIYYDKLGNPIEFNPDDFVIEEVLDADGPPDIMVTLPAPSEVRPKSSVSRPKSAVAGRAFVSKGRRLAAKRIRKVVKEGV